MTGIGEKWFNKFINVSFNSQDFEKEDITSSEVMGAVKTLIEEKPELIANLSSDQLGLFQKKITDVQVISGSEGTAMKVQQLVDSILQLKNDALARDLPGAYQDPFQFLENLAQYGAIDPKILAAIVKIAVAQDGRRVSMYIKKYGIMDQQVLGDIAKIAAGKSGFGVSQYIQEYGITDQQVLIDIAKIAAGQSGGGVSYFIKKYRITEQQVLIEIAKIAAGQNGRGLSRHIKEYGITDQKARMEIAGIAIQNEPAVLDFLNNFELDQSTSEYKDMVANGLLLRFIEGDDIFVNHMDLLAAIASFLVEQSIDLGGSKEKINNFLFSLLQSNGRQILPESLGDKAGREKIFRKLADYGNKGIAGALVAVLREKASSESFMEAYHSLVFEKTQG